MKYRVWCDDMDTWLDGRAIDASMAESAARKLLDELDDEGKAFPDENDGDGCVISVCEWRDDEDEDGDVPEHETFVFKLIVERRVELR